MRQVIGELNARHVGVDGQSLSAVGVPGLGIEGFELAGAACHPKQDAGHAAASQFIGPQADDVGPVHRPGRQSRRSHAAQEVAAPDNAVRADVHVQMMF